MSVPAEIARRIAEAVLYEGRPLTPCQARVAEDDRGGRPGALVPPGCAATTEPSGSMTECLLERAESATVSLCLRFLHMRNCDVEHVGGDGGPPTPVGTQAGGGGTYLTFDETTRREVEAAFPVAVLLGGERTVEVRVPGDRLAEPVRGPSGRTEGRVVREHLPVRAALTVGAERLAGPYGLIRLRVRVRNTTVQAERDAPREHVLRRSLLSAHLIIGVDGGGFVSLADPPEWARPFAEGCRNEHTWPALVGEPGHRDVVLSSPVTLSDYPDDLGCSGDEEAIA
ncbi:hypothetical protein AB0395_08600 [Streptosporangium sp. NPDC051023]|uniref:hypothetical protein n=1 Tax=Streptosporangium sp. NPDC051023 TaxID=3155410 RepID=UPI00345091AF